MQSTKSPNLQLPETGFVRIWQIIGDEKRGIPPVIPVQRLPPSARVMGAAVLPDTSRTHENARCCVFDGGEVQTDGRAEKIAQTAFWCVLEASRF